MALEHVGYTSFWGYKTEVYEYCAKWSTGWYYYLGPFSIRVLQYHLWLSGLSIPHMPHLWGIGII